MNSLVLITVSFMLFHFAVKWLESRQAALKDNGRPLGLFDYIASVPAFTTVAIIGTVSMFLLAYEMEWLNAGMAAACGYGGSDLAKRVLKQYENISELKTK